MRTLDLVIRKEGRIAQLTLARKHHRCAACSEYILPATQYYAITIGGSGVGGKINSSRVHPGCLGPYLEKVKRAKEY